MKKRLEAELISIAHRILKLKNKSEIDQLYKETQKLYETLAVLKFYQDNFESVKDDVSEAVLEEKLEAPAVVELSPEPVAEVKEEVLEAVAEATPEVEEEPDSGDSKQAKQTEAEETQPEVEETEEVEPADDVEQPEAEAEVAAALEEEPAAGEEEDTSDNELAEQIVAEEKPSFQPIFELEAEEDIPAEVATEYKAEEKLEDMIGNYADPVFEKKNETSLFPPDSSDSELAKQTKAEEPVKEELGEAKPAAVSQSSSKSIAIGLNDRIGFVQHLFNDSNEDFNRVISQLNTFDTFEEAKNFINEMVIPDYGYWVGAEDYMERFMAIVEKKFE